MNNAPASRNRRTARRWAWAALVLLAIAVHLVGLGGRSFHHDESIHARLSYDLLHDGVYRYDPTYHGPLLYYLTAATFAVLGDSNFTARLPVAVAGVLLVWVAWRLRRPFGERAAWWTGLLFTISPIFLYYGRFLRMDVLEAATASAAFVALYAAIHGRRRAWTWVGLWAGLAFATKENAYVTVFLAVVSAVLVGLACGPRRSLSALVAWLREQWIEVATAASVFIVVTVPLYTVGFTRAADWNFPFRAIGYWWRQHEIARVGGPWWFHLPRLAQYELLPILAALVWIVRRRRRLRPVEGFLFAFGVLSIGLYCYLGEKTPWLEVHQVWAFIPLAGAQLARTFGHRGRSWSRAVAGLGIAATLAAAFTASFVLDEITPAQRRVESMIFVQTCPEMRQVAEEGVRLGASAQGVVASVSGEAAWPLMWYWRRLDISWAAPRPGQRPPLVICDPEDEGAVRTALGPGYRRRRIPLRAWWLMYDRRPSPGQVLRYELTRIPWGSIGSTDVIVLERGTGELPAVQQVPVSPVLASLPGVTSIRVLAQGRLGEPRGVAAWGSRIAVADAALSRVLLVAADGTVRETATGADLSQPEAVAWLNRDLLVVADTWNHRVLRVDVGSGETTALPVPPGGWYGPRGVAVAPDGALAVTDTGNKRVVLYDSSLQTPGIVGEGGEGPGQLIEPVGIAWLDRATFVVCDVGNRRLQVFDREGRVRRIVSLPGAWPDFYSRPQIAVLGPEDWVATDTPGKTLWRVRGSQVSRISLAGLELDPTGIAWDPQTRSLVIGDLSGKVWVLEVPDA